MAACLFAALCSPRKIAVADSNAQRTGVAGRSCRLLRAIDLDWGPRDIWAG
jgi:hypothetical protein